MARLRGNPDDRIGIPLSVGYFAENGGAINGGGTRYIVRRIGICRSVGVFLSSDSCLFPGAGCFWPDVDWIFRRRGSFRGESFGFSLNVR